MKLQVIGSKKTDHSFEDVVVFEHKIGFETLLKFSWPKNLYFNASSRESFEKQSKNVPIPKNSLPATS